MLQYDKSMQIFTAIAYSIVIIISLIISKLLKNKEEKTKKIPLYIISGLILFLEMHKQIRNCLGYNYNYFYAIFKGMTNEFDTYALPFHFCSFFMFWVLFDLIFMKHERLSKFFNNMAFLWATFIFVLMFFYPEMVYGSAIRNLILDGNLEYSTVFHFLVLLYFWNSFIFKDLSF